MLAVVSDNPEDAGVADDPGDGDIADDPGAVDVADDSEGVEVTDDPGDAGVSDDPGTVDASIATDWFNEFCENKLDVPTEESCDVDTSAVLPVGCWLVTMAVK